MKSLAPGDQTRALLGMIAGDELLVLAIRDHSRGLDAAELRRRQVRLLFIELAELRL